MNLANGSEHDPINIIEGVVVSNWSLEQAKQLLEKERSSADKSNILETVLTTQEILDFSIWTAMLIQKQSKFKPLKMHHINQLEEIQLAKILYAKSPGSPLLSGTFARITIE